MAGPLSPALAPAPPIPAVGPLRGYVDYYRTAMRIAISTQFQYRISNAFFMVGLIAEPLIYLVVFCPIWIPFVLLANYFTKRVRHFA